MRIGLLIQNRVSLNDVVEKSKKIKDGQQAVSGAQSEGGGGIGENEL